MNINVPGAGGEGAHVDSLQNYTEPFEFDEVTDSDVLEAVQGLRGVLVLWDNIRAVKFKTVQHLTLQPLKYLINLSFNFITLCAQDINSHAFL